MRTTENLIIARGGLGATSGLIRDMRGSCELERASRKPKLPSCWASTGPRWRDGNWANARRRVSTSIATVRFWTAWPARGRVLPDLEVAAVPREELPSLLGRLVELEARVRLRLAQAPTTTPAAVSRILDAEEAAAIAGTSKRFLLAKTRGLKFRCDLSRKQPRFDDTGLRQWLAGRRK